MRHLTVAQDMDIRAALHSLNMQLCLRSDNYVGAIGAATLANALQQNSTLQELSLKGNELVNEGTRALCKAFEERQGAITSLDLGNNRCALKDAPCEPESTPLS